MEKKFSSNAIEIPYPKNSFLVNEKKIVLKNMYKIFFVQTSR